MFGYELEAAGNSQCRLQSLTGDNTTSEGSCNTDLTMLDCLRGLELDLHEHIRKENNDLFPRAAKLEASLR